MRFGWEGEGQESVERRASQDCQDTKLSSQGLPDRHRYVRLETEREENKVSSAVIAQSQYR